MYLRWLSLLTVVVLAPQPMRAETVDDLLKAAETALLKKQTEEALKLASQAIAADPKNARAYFLRGVAHDVLRRHAEAVGDLDKALALDPKAPEAYDLRGSAHFKLGHIRESLADFDQFLVLKPEARPGHWRRGITCYYAGQFEEGRKQFAAYEQVDTNDVENAVWHYLCVARTAGVAKARAALLKIGSDRRVPMMEVYALFAGQAQPADVLAAAQAGTPTAEQLQQRLFYAHLYLGLYHEAAGEPVRALEHLTKAAADYRLPHYMGDVARVHVELRRQESQRP
jgi:lipoprotein NlpI